MLIKQSLKRTLLVGGTILTIGAASVAGMGVASAATTGTSGTSLVDKIATKFNLKKADVQQVFDQNRTEQQAAREQKMKDRLDQAVKDGKITQDQEDKLIAKLKELQADRTAIKDMKEETQAERDARKAKMDAFKQWLTDNKIPEDLARPMGGPGHRGMGMHDGDTPPAK